MISTKHYEIKLNYGRFCTTRTINGTCRMCYLTEANSSQQRRYMQQKMQSKDNYLLKTREKVCTRNMARWN
jgi:hypothetical protein